MTTISEKDFKKLCDDIYMDRWQIYAFIPNVSRREALLWMLLGCLVSLLSIPILEQPSVYNGSSADPYGDAIREVVLAHTDMGFDPGDYLLELSRKIESE
jgi:hypothetical protein